MTKQTSMTGREDRPWQDMNSGVMRAPIAPSALGHAEITPSGRFEAGTYASFTLVYTAGTFGIDDSGSLRVCFRFASDQGNPQFDDPKAANYCTVEASNGAVLQLRWDPKGNVRPWDRTLWIKVVKGFLEEGDTITIRFGVTDHGGAGMRLRIRSKRWLVMLSSSPNVWSQPRPPAEEAAVPAASRFRSAPAFEGAGASLRTADAAAIVPCCTKAS